MADVDTNPVRESEANESSDSAARLGSRPKLTVVLAVRAPDFGQLSRCIASFAALRLCREIEVVVVSCGETLRFDSRVIERLAGLIIVANQPKGVYAAFFEGCLHSRAPFVLFFGVDDIALSGLDEIVDALDERDCETLMYVGPCLMQGRGIHRPSRFRLSIAYRNWCQQGIVYRTDCIRQRGFSRSYPVLADHHLNIQLLASSTRCVRRFHEPVAYFSSGGVSSLRRDYRFQADQFRVVTEAFGLTGALVLFARVAARKLLGRRSFAS
jgi:hypothetical protein